MEPNNIIDNQFTGIINEYINYTKNKKDFEKRKEDYYESLKSVLEDYGIDTTNLNESELDEKLTILYEKTNTDSLLENLYGDGVSLHGEEKELQERIEGIITKYRNSINALKNQIKKMEVAINRNEEEIESLSSTDEKKLKNHNLISSIQYENGKLNAQIFLLKDALEKYNVNSKDVSEINENDLKKLVEIQEKIRNRIEKEKEENAINDWLFDEDEIEQEEPEQETEEPKQEVEEPEQETEEPEQEVEELSPKGRKPEKNDKEPDQETGEPEKEVEETEQEVEELGFRWGHTAVDPKDKRIFSDENRDRNGKLVEREEEVKEKDEGVIIVVLKRIGKGIKAGWDQTIGKLISSIKNRRNSREEIGGEQPLKALPPNNTQQREKENALDIELVEEELPERDDDWFIHIFPEEDAEIAESVKNVAPDMSDRFGYNIGKTKEEIQEEQSRIAEEAKKTATQRTSEKQNDGFEEQNDGFEWPDEPLF